jgi:hypothetical protein
MTITKITLLALLLILGTSAIAQELIKPTWNFGPPEPYPRSSKGDFDSKKIKAIEALRAANILPPAEFDHPYNGALYIVRGTQKELRAARPTSFRSQTSLALGCRPHLDADGCTIYIAHDADLALGGLNYDIVFRHERAHCLGWWHPPKD